MSKHPFSGRREDERLVTGRGRYTNDWNLDGQAFAFFRRSDRAHALLVKVEKNAAELVDGVLAVFTGVDLVDVPFGSIEPFAPPPGRGGQNIQTPLRPLLARDRVRFVGEEIALVIASTTEAARDAADLIEVEYEELPVIVGFEAALSTDAFSLHSNIEGNVCFDFEYGDESKVTEAFRKAPGVVKLTVQSPRVAPNPMEPRGALISYDACSQSYDIYCASQGALAFRSELGQLAGIDVERLRMHSVDVGGAFGARTGAFPEYPLLMYAARVLGRPIKWLSTRSEDFLTDNHGRAISIRGSLAYDEAGRFLALQTDWLCDSGAYLTAAGVLTNCINGMTIGGGIYCIDAVYGRHRQVLTNTAPTNAYRGAGRPEAVYIVERLVDEVASRLQCDALELRRLNAIKHDEMPYRTCTGTLLDSGDFPGLIDMARAHSNWDAFPERRDESLSRKKLRGRGCSTFFEPSGGGHIPVDEVAIQIDRSGTVNLFCAAGSSGQGHETVFPELVEKWLGLPPSTAVLKGLHHGGPRIRGNPSIGSRSAMLQGSAFGSASDLLLTKAKSLAAQLLETDVHDLDFTRGIFRVVGTDRSVTITEVIQHYQTDGAHPLDTIAKNPVTRSFPYGAHIVELEIDETTGSLEIVSYCAVDDIGNVLNQTLADGQIIGGMLQGAGQAFGECCLYDQDGQLITGSFMDYTMPRAQLIADISLFNYTHPSCSNILGAKGAGEAGTTGALAACMNAVVDALRPLGINHCEMPVTPFHLWKLIKEARPAV